MTRTYTLGIDLGGTNVRVGVVTKRGRIVKSAMCPVGSVRSPHRMIEIIAELLKPIVPPAKSQVLGIGCGFPGIVDVRSGVIGRAPHYPSWKGVPFREMLSDAFDLPVVLDNDANMTAVGEMLWGAAKGLKDFVMITLGTGIGGGIVIDGELYRGEFGYAGEIGHQVIERRGVACDCGSYGCWEEYAAAGFLKKRAGGGKLAEKRARNREAKAMRLWEEFGRNFGIGINNLINVLGITNFVVGGGVARAADLFFHHARDEIRRRAYPQNAKRLKLIKSKLIDAAGILGSAAAVLKDVD